jgi:large subunit ribosomal protein L5
MSKINKDELAEGIAAVIAEADKVKKAGKQPAPNKEKTVKEVKTQPEVTAETVTVKVEKAVAPPATEKKAQPAAKPEAKAEVKAEQKPAAQQAQPAAKDKKAPAPKKADSPDRYRLRKIYAEKVLPELTKRFSYKNVNEVPRLVKVSLNMGLGDVKDDGKKFNMAVDELKLISGQKPVVCKAKKSVANFKVREGMNVGAKVTMRGVRMYEFMDKLISVALPRVRDFKGVNPDSFDGRGNYAMGVKEQLIFPEIKYDQIDKIRGFDIIIVTTAKSDEEAKGLLELLGLPFRNK